MVWNIPAACNRSTADYMISSPLMDADYERQVPDYDGYLKRPIPAAEPLPPTAPEPPPAGKPV